jgi:hypothetical protein
MVLGRAHVSLLPPRHALRGRIKSSRLGADIPPAGQSSQHRSSRVSVAWIFHPSSRKINAGYRRAPRSPEGGPFGCPRLSYDRPAEQLAVAVEVCSMGDATIAVAYTIAFAPH